MKERGKSNMIPTFTVRVMERVLASLIKTEKVAAEVCLGKKVTIFGKDWVGARRSKVKASSE